MTVPTVMPDQAYERRGLSRPLSLGVVHPAAPGDVVPSAVHIAGVHHLVVVADAVPPVLPPLRRGAVGRGRWQNPPPHRKGLRSKRRVDLPNRP